MNKKLAKLFLWLIVIVFISSYLISSSGYYEYTMQQRTVMTSEKIKQFEEDVKNNEDIDLKKYLEEDAIDYSNKFSNLVYSISDNSNKLAKKLIKTLFKKLSYLVED